jgi:hypothetical protein
MTVTASLATIRDRGDREVARVEAQPGDRDLAVRIIYQDKAWQERLASLDDGKLRFMINGAVYLQRGTADEKEFLALASLVPELTHDELRIEYDDAEVEHGHALLREIAMKETEFVPFSELLEILRNSVHARRRETHPSS